MSKIVFFDTETGGLDHNIHGLLSIAFVVCNDGDIIDSIEVLVNDGKLLTEEALNVNKINIVEHNKVALSPIEAVKVIDLFLSKYFTNKNKIVLAGHNVAFDINFLKTLIKTSGISLSVNLSHRSIDICAILQYLYFCGFFHRDLGYSDAAFEYFDIEFEEGTRHTALGDAVATAKLFKKLVELV